MTTPTTAEVGHGNKKPTVVEIAGFRGRLISPDHADYDIARAVWNGAIDRRPRLIARCIGTTDVVAAVRFARVYVNFLGGDEDPGRVREAYGDSVYDRLVDVKTTYDPTTFSTTTRTSDRLSDGEGGLREVALASRRSAKADVHSPDTRANIPVMAEGRYQIVEIIGRGGMGEVCLADDVMLDRKVALKFVTAPGETDGLEQLLGEARAAAALDHPFICSIYEVTDARRPPLHRHGVRPRRVARAAAARRAAAGSVRRCAWRKRSPRRSTPRTSGASFTATSSRRT